MEWCQPFILIVTLAGLFLWNRSESIADYRHLEAGVSAQIKAIHEETKAIHHEMKDFHGRLCAIEERNKSNSK